MKLKFKIPNNIKNWADRALWYIKTLEKEIDILLSENEKLRFQLKKLENENKKLKLKNINLKRENKSLNFLLKDIYFERKIIEH
jgi:regulator of replication initiation timing